jgi:hypothetical protein
VVGSFHDGKSFQLAGHDALMHCVMTNNSEALNRLLTMDKYDLDFSPGNGQWTLLQTALQRSCLETTSLLLQHGANPNFASKGTPLPLELAKRSGRKVLVALVQKYLESNAPNSQTNVDVHAAELQGNWRQVYQPLDGALESSEVGYSLSINEQTLTLAGHSHPYKLLPENMIQWSYPPEHAGIKFASGKYEVIDQDHVRLSVRYHESPIDATAWPKTASSNNPEEGVVYYLLIRTKDSAATVPPIEFDTLEKLVGNERDSAESRFANEPSWASSSVVSNSTLDGIWDVVEINWCGQVWISNGAQVLIENGKWVGFDPHETEDPTQNISRDFAIGPDNEFCRIETDGKLRYLQPGRFRLEADQLWLAVQQCSLPSETPIRAIPTVSEPNVTYYRLSRRKAGGQEENTNVTRKQSGAKNSALFNRPTIEDITRIYNDNTAVLRRELFQPPIQDLTVEQMRAALRLAAEIETRDSSRPKTGKLLEKFAESGVLSRKNGELLSYGTHEMDENGNTIARMIVPTFLIVNADGPKDERGQLDKEPVVLTSLSLSYRKNGYASQTYEHLTEAKDTLEGFLKPGRELFDKEMK